MVGPGAIEKPPELAVSKFAYKNLILNNEFTATTGIDYNRDAAKILQDVFPSRFNEPQKQIVSSKFYEFFQAYDRYSLELKLDKKRASEETKRKPEDIKDALNKVNEAYDNLCLTFGKDKEEGIKNLKSFLEKNVGGNVFIIFSNDDRSYKDNQGCLLAKNMSWNMTNLAKWANVTERGTYISWDIGKWEEIIPEKVGGKDFLPNERKAIKNTIDKTRKDIEADARRYENSNYKAYVCNCTAVNVSKENMQPVILKLDDLTKGENLYGDQNVKKW